MPLKLVNLCGWTIALICAIGWFWQFVRTQEGLELQAKAKRKLNQLTKALRETQDERDEALQRIQDRDLYNKKFGHEPMVRDVIPVIDDFERALSPEMAGSFKGLLHGVKLIRTQVLDILRRHGVTSFEAEGEDFDPKKHEAVDKVATNNYLPGKILKQAGPGYMLHDRLLRAAQVTVAISPLGGPDPTEEAEKE